MGVHLLSIATEPRSRSTLQAPPPAADRVEKEERVQKNRIATVAMGERPTLERAEKEKDEVQHRQHEADLPGVQPDNDQQPSGDSDQLEESLERDARRMAGLGIGQDLLHPVTEHEEAEDDPGNALEIRRQHVPCASCS